MIPVFEATPDTFDALVLERSRSAGELVLVYFWGPNCPNCEFFAARLPSLRESLGDVRARIVKVDAYAHAELGARFAIFGIPQFHLFRDGKHIGRMSEFRGDAFFLAVLREHLPPGTKAAGAVEPGEPS